MDPQIITVTEANDHLRLDLALVATSPLTYDDDRLPGLLVKIVAAESIVLDYLKVDPADLAASPPAWPVRERDLEVVRAAILLILSALWDDAPERTIAEYMRFADGLRAAGTIPLLLARLRDPTVA